MSEIDDNAARGDRKLIYGLLIVLGAGICIFLFLMLNASEGPELGLITSSNSATDDADGRGLVPDYIQGGDHGRTRIKRAKAPKPKPKSKKQPRKTGATKDEPVKEEKKKSEALLVQQHGSLTVKIVMDERQKRRFRYRRLPRNIVVRLEPITGLDPALHRRTGEWNFDTMQVTFSKLKAVTWQVVIAGVRAGRVTVEPDKKTSFAYNMTEPGNRLERVHLLVADEGGEAVDGADIYWIQTKLKSYIHREVFVGRTGLWGQLATVSSRQGAFIARHKGKPVALFERNDKVAKANHIWNPGVLVAIVKGDEGATVKGRVRSAMTGSGLKGAVVEIFSGGNPLVHRQVLEKELEHFRMQLRYGKSAPYPANLGVRTTTSLTGAFSLHGVPLGQAVIVVRVPGMQSPEPKRIFITKKGLPKINLTMKPGVTAYGRTFIPDGRDQIPSIGTHNKGVYRPRLARDGSYFLSGLPSFEVTLGVLTKPWFSQFVELRTFLIPEDDKRLRCDILR